MTSYLAKLLEVEYNNIQKGHGLIDTEVDFVLESNVPDEGGRLCISGGTGVCKGSLKAFSRRMRTMVPHGVLEMKDYLQETHPDNSKDNLWNHCGKMMRWGQPAAKEFMDEEFHVGVTLIRNAMGKNTPDYDSQKPVHVTAEFELDTETEVSELSVVLDEAFGLEMGEAKKLFYQEQIQGENYVDNDHVRRSNRRTIENDNEDKE
jgi:hypothetical protein